MTAWAPAVWSPGRWASTVRVAPRDGLGPVHRQPNLPVAAVELGVRRCRRRCTASESLATCNAMRPTSSTPWVPDIAAVARVMAASPPSRALAYRLLLGKQADGIHQHSPAGPRESARRARSRSVCPPIGTTIGHSCRAAPCLGIATPAGWHPAWRCRRRSRCGPGPAPVSADRT